MPNKPLSLVTGNAYSLLILAPLLWGGNAVAGRLATEDWQPFTLTSLRWLFAVMVLTPFALAPLKRDLPVIRGQAILMFSLGASMAAFNLTMFLALNFTTAINVSIVQATMPGMIMMANFFVLSQRVRALQIAGLVLTLFGVLVTTTAGDLTDFFADGQSKGDVIMLLACVFYAAYTFGLRWRPQIHWMSFMWVIALSAFITTIPFSVWELSTSQFSMPSYQGLMVLVYVAIFPTIISQLSWARGVELIGSNRAGLFINLVPIFGSILGVLILREYFAWYHFVGLSLVLVGIGMAERAADKS